MSIHFRIDPLPSQCAAGLPSDFPSRSHRLVEPASTRLPMMHGIQYLRGAAATAVVLLHASQSAGFTIEAGAFGVDIFFVLSGFLMAVITGEASRPWPFLRDRMLRIVPLYWIASVAALCLGAAGIFWTPSRMQALASFAFVPFGPPTAGPEFFPVLTVGWTLNYEMFFYCMFAGTLFLPRRARLPALTVLFVTIVAARGTPPPQSAPLLFWSDPIILEFLAGAWVGTFWRRDGAYRPPLGWALMAAAAVAFLVARHPGPASLLGSHVALSIPAVLLLLAVIQFERRPGGVERHRLPATIGDASYSIYLWHLFAIAAVELAVRALALPLWTVFPIAVPAAIAAGIVGYRKIEEPLLAAVRSRSGGAAQRTARQAG
jgi:exopolysaccharide production protein ExoZ